MLPVSLGRCAHPAESVDGTSWAGLLDDPAGRGHAKAAAFSQFPRCWPANDPTHTSADYGLFRYTSVPALRFEEPCRRARAAGSFFWRAPCR